MSITLSMRRLSPQATAAALAGESVEVDAVEVFDEIDKGWDLLGRLLAGGRLDPADPDLPPAARAVAGGAVLAEYLPDEVRLILPADAAAVHRALLDIDEAEIRRRYESVDFTGCYGADYGRPTDSFERLRDEVRFLADFYGRAVADQSAVLMWCE